MKPSTLKELQQLAIAKHGEDHAYVLAYQFGNINHRSSWQSALDEPSRHPEQVLEHQIWQEKVKADFKHRWENELKEKLDKELGI